MNVLVIAPHPDDETLGCGGALLKHIAAGITFVHRTGGFGEKRLPETMGSGACVFDYDGESGLTGRRPFAEAPRCGPPRT